MNDYSKIVDAHCYDCSLLWLKTNFGSTNPSLLELPHEMALSANRNDPKVKFKLSSGQTLDFASFLHPECSRHDLPTFGQQSICPSPFGPLACNFRKNTPGCAPSIVLAHSWQSSTNSSRSAILGRGVADDLALAHQIANAELVERLCAFCVPRHRIVWGSFAEIGSTSLVHVPADNDVPRWWCEGQESSKSTLYIPLEIVVLGQYSRVKWPIGRATSCGIAAHPNKQQATRNAEEEWLERASLRALWHAKVTTQIDVNSLSHTCGTLLEQINRIGFRAQLIPVNLVDGFTAIAALATPICSDDLQTLVVASSGAWDVERAIASCLKELYAQVFNTTELTHARLIANARRKNMNVDALLCNWGVKNADKVLVSSLQAKGDRVAQLPPDIPTVHLDRGNNMSDTLGLHVRQVIIPSLPTMSEDEILREGYQNPFAPI